VIIAVGGGSAIDLAKLVAMLAVNRRPLSDFYGENRVSRGILPVIAMPTTAGTGSEVTPVAVVSDPERELKVGISSPHLIPRRAIVDPLLTIGAPGSVTAHSGIDAFVHAVESYTARGVAHSWGEELPVFVGRNRFSSLLALEAVSAIGANLRTAVNTPGDLDAREAMSWGSLLAGMAFGAGGTHISHALQYPVGAATKTPHGLGTGLLLPYVLEACLPAIVPELADIAHALDLPEDGAEASAIAAIAAIRSLVVDIGVPTRLADLGVTAGQLSRFAELGVGVTRLAGNAPVAPGTDLFTRILRAALDGSTVAAAPSAEGATS
jgi:alcohol dehydrogenase